MNHRVEASNSYLGFGNDGTFVRADVLAWLTANVGKPGHYSSKHGWKGRWRTYDGGIHSVFYFTLLKHALLFKLTWGGK